MRYLFFFFLIPSLTLGQTVADYIKEAKKAERHGKMIKALNLYNKAIALRPQNPTVYIRKGNIKGEIAEIIQSDYKKRYLFNQDKYVAAIANFDQAIALDSSNYIGYYARGNLNMIYQKYELAIHDFSNVLAKTDDKNITCYSLNQRGLAKMHTEYYESAKHDFHHALKLTNYKLNLYNNIAVLNMRIGRTYLAFDAMEKALQISPEDLYTKNNFGLLKIELGEIEDAIKLFEDIIKQSADPVFYNNRAYAYYQIRNYTIALQDVNKSIDMWKKNAYAYRNRGLIYIAQKKYTKACHDFELAEKYGFSKIYGSEVKKLKAKYCW